MEYCFIKNEIVEEILVCDEAFAEAYTADKSYDSYVERPSNVGLGMIYRSGKFYQIIDGEEVEVVPAN